MFPQPPFQVFQISYEVLPKTFYEIEIRETNNYQLLRNFEKIEFENKMTPCLLGSHFKIQGSQFTRRLSKPFDTVLSVGVDSGRKTIIRKNLEGGSSWRLVLHAWICICVDQEGASISRGRGGKSGGKRSGRERRTTQQTQQSISTIDVKRNEGLFCEISRELAPTVTSIEMDSSHCIFWVRKKPLSL